MKFLNLTKDRPSEYCFILGIFVVINYNTEVNITELREGKLSLSNILGTAIYLVNIQLKIILKHFSE